MQAFRALAVLLVCVGLRCVPIAAEEEGSRPRVEPVVSSVHPFTIQRGTEFTATVRGSGLLGTNSAFVSGAPIQVSIEAIETESQGDVKARKDLVRVRTKVAADAKPGRYPFRLVTLFGVSNALTFHVTESPVTPEPERTHETPESAVEVSSVPMILTGRLSRHGEADYYAFQAQAGQTLTFEAISGLPQIASAGSAATIPNFDPSLTIFEPAGSWFDNKRPKRIAYNDEPMWVFGRVTDAHLVHQFARDGSYLLRVEAFAGQGGPDYGYQLKVLAGSVPQDLATVSRGWEERGFSRPLSTDRLNQLAARGVSKQDKPSIETYRAAADPENSPVFRLPAMIEGTLGQPGETHRFRFDVDGPKDLAIEVETPATAPPFFNPIVRLLNGSGEEVASNLFAGRGACNGALTKSLQAKTTIPVRDAGVYTVEIREAAADLAGAGFRYRVQVRPQVPHVGRVNIDVDRVNLAPEEAKTIRVVFDREEDYRGAIAVVAESLPAGVHAVVGADFEPDKDPPLATGKRERYTPRTERAVLILTATSTASPMPQPELARIVVRPVLNGRMGDVIATKQIPLMVIAKP